MPRSSLKARTGLITGVALWLIAAVAAIAFWLGGRGPAVADHVDLSSPTASTQSFLKCLAAGHAVDVFACVVSDPEQQQFARGLTDAIAAGLEIEHLTVLPATDSAVVDQANPVIIDGERAILVMPGEGEARRFIVLYEDGAWRVDLVASTGLRAQEAAAYLERLENATTPVPSAE